jgi:hypothetical protein
VICGGRDYELTAADRTWLAEQLRERGVVGVIHGDANTWRKANAWGPRRRVGADRMGAAVAREIGLPVKAYPYPSGRGRRGGPERNARMAKIAAGRVGSVVIAFPGGAGTENMIAAAVRRGLEVVKSPTWAAEEWQHGD